MDEVIGFTGHLDCVTEENYLEDVDKRFPGALWIQGEARHGFDRQVKLFAETRKIRMKGYPPDASKGFPAAFFDRNRKIAEACTRLVACYDGRLRGGTRFTVNHALKLGKPVEYVKCVPLPNELRPKHRRKATSGR